MVMIALPAETARSGSFSRHNLLRGWALVATVNLASLCPHAAAELRSGGQPRAAVPTFTAEGGCPHENLRNGQESSSRRTKGSVMTMGLDIRPRANRSATSR